MEGNLELTCAASLPGKLRNTRAQRIKTSTTYTTVIGDRLNIIGLEDSTDMNLEKPTHHRRTDFASYTDLAVSCSRVCWLRSSRLREWSLGLLLVVHDWLLGSSQCLLGISSARHEASATKLAGWLGIRSESYALLPATQFGSDFGAAIHATLRSIGDSGCSHVCCWCRYCHLVSAHIGGELESGCRASGSPCVSASWALRYYSTPDLFRIYDVGGRDDSCSRRDQSFRVVI
jgi:hypothetical protein